jgi:hypothetical protein
LVRNNENRGQRSGLARNYSYRMATELLKKEQHSGPEEDQDYYGSERDFDLEDDDQDQDDLEEVLDSDDDEGEGLLPNESNKGHAPIPRRMSLLEFQQESLSKTQVLQRLVFCSLMLNITFVMWGALQVWLTMVDGSKQTRPLYIVYRVSRTFLTRRRLLSFFLAMITSNDINTRNAC